MAAAIWREIQQRMHAAHASKRAGVERDLELLEEAKDLALGRREKPSADLERHPVLLDRVHALRKYQEEHGDLPSISAVEALIRYMLERAAEQAKHGSSPIDLEQLRRRWTRDFDPRHTADSLAEPAWIISRLLIEEVNQGSRGRTRADWWRAAVLVLLAEAIELSTMELGFPEELPLCGQQSGEGGTFACRDLITTYMETGIEAGDAVTAVAELAQRVAARLPPIADLGEASDLDPHESPREEGREQAVSASPDEHSYIFQKEGAVWRVAFGGASSHVKDSVGMGYIDELLRRQGEAVAVEELENPAGAGALAVKSGSDQLVTDKKALAEARQRERELEDGLSGEADPARQATMKEELEALRHQLGRDTGLRGSIRHMRDGRQRAVERVGQAIRRALGVLREEAHPLWLHLSDSIQYPTGREPCYAPKARVEWVLEPS